MVGRISVGDTGGCVLGSEAVSMLTALSLVLRCVHVFLLCCVLTCVPSVLQCLLLLTWSVGAQAL